ncbi:MAG: YrbL family protein [Pseudoruegeria sp.]
MFDEPMKLGDSKPLARGTYRSIYSVPGRDDVMIKVMHPPELNPAKPIRNWIKARSRTQMFRFLFREYDYYLRLKIQQEELQEPLPITNLMALIQTDKGLGMVVEKIGPKGDGIGKTVEKLQSSGNFTDYHVALINELIQQIMLWDMQVNDMNPGNIVLDEKGDTDRFVLVDGFGDSNFIPIKSFLKSANSRSLSKKFDSLAKYLQKSWDSEAKRIE